MSPDERPKRPPITDSPWYWLYLFATTGLIALVLVGPKFDLRQTEIERQYQGRMRAAQKKAGQTPATPMSTEGNTQINLRPLYLILAALLAVGWGVLWWRHFRRGGDVSESGKRKATS